MVQQSETKPGTSMGRSLDLQRMDGPQIEQWITQRTNRLKEIGFEPPMDQVVGLVQHGIGEMYDDIRAADGTVDVTTGNLLMAMWTLNPYLVQNNLGDVTQIASDIHMGVSAWRDKHSGVGLPSSLTTTPVPSPIQR